MKRGEPAWFETAVSELLNDTPIAEVARKCGVRRETISRALNAPDSTLKAEIERRRSAAATPATAPGALVEKANVVLQQHMDGEDPKLRLDAAKVALARAPQAAPTEATPEPEITSEDALRELILALPSLADLARTGALPLDVVEQFRAACRVFLADDLKPRAPIDLEAERVDLTPPEQTDDLSPPGSAQIIPIR
jgi:hypothetical protein